MEQANDRSALAARVRIRRAQKAWKFLRDVNNTSLNDLNRVALEDGAHSYTYGLMFREWERYASVFSALGMTGEAHSRVGLLGSTCVETIFALYGLNMVGADVSVVPTYSALMPKRIIQTIRDERLTDFIVTDDFAQANLINELLLQQKELGLEHIILLHVPVNGVTVHPMLTAAQETKYHQIKGLYKPICMDELLAAHGNHPVHYAPEDSGDTAFILHTSGTTTGAGRPVALSDAACNAAAAVFYQMKELPLPMDHLVTAVIVDLSNAYSMIDQVHLPLAMGAKVVLAPGGILNPWFYRAVAKYEISVLFTISAMFERWMKLPEGTDFDFSSLRLVVLGGAAVSAADKRRFDAFLRAHGAGEITLLNGYGISELGGACCLSSPELDDEAIGYPLPGVNVRLFDDESGKFLSARKTPCEGVLYLNSPSVATPELDGETILKYEVLNHRPFICTNDLVRMDPDGKLTFLGRANRYFINEEGRRFESGRVEAEIARQEGIESCCIVPVYVKTTHDNIPQLCVATLPEAGAAQEVVLRALKKVYVTERTLGPDQLPSRVMLAIRLPRNGNGKIDLFQIGRGEVEGGVFTLESVRADGEITDFRLVPCPEGPADMIQEVFDGISAELEGSMPFHPSKEEDNKEVSDMKYAKMAYEGFNAMNRMGRQMMSNMMGRMSQNEDAFASVKSLSCGGSYLPQDKLKKHIDFARAHGYQGYIFRGYGMSELVGVEITVPPDSDADILGFPHPVEDFRVQDDDGQFYTADQGERTGVLYATSKTMCLNVLDGETLFDLIEIDGRKFLCTNDKVRVNANGSFSYAGRADRYFANNEGIRFEAGQVETELSRQPGISRCVVAPVLDKRIHDSVPVLYVVPEAQGEAGAEAVRQALVNVFIGGGLAERSCLPSQFVLVNDIPCNSSGKVDVFRVTRERLRGRAYNIVPVHRDGVLADIATALTDHPDSITGGTLIEGMEGRSALGIYDLFNASSAGRNAGFLPGLFSLLDFTK